MEFRKLKADEVEVRAVPNNGGVSLLLYKDARCDQNILDEAVGPLGWQRHHSRDNANCIVSIYDDVKKQWVEKEDTGKESANEKEKGLASDSFKRACFNWGIGRELYTAPKMYVPKEMLKGFNVSQERVICNDRFVCKSLEYNEDKTRIKKVVIEISYYGKVHHNVTFSNEQKQETAMPIEELSPTHTTPASTGSSGLISDDEIILIGNCKGRRYGDVKNEKVFMSFLNWLKTSSTVYEDPAKQNQAERFKKL